MLSRFQAGLKRPVAADDLSPLPSPPSGESAIYSRFLTQTIEDDVLTADGGRVYVLVMLASRGLRT